MSAILEKHACGCDHLKESCPKCWGLLSPTTEAALQGRIDYLIRHEHNQDAAAAIDRRQDLRNTYTKHFRRGYPGVKRG